VIDREAWLAARRQGIGGSDAAALMGCHPWHSLTSLYLDKIGMSEDEDSQLLRWGRRLEGAVLAEYEHVTGLTVATHEDVIPDRIAVFPGGVRMLRHPSSDVAIGNTDGVVLDPDRGPGVIDGKVVLRYKFREWIRDGRPRLNYLVQLAHYMEVTGLRWATIAAFSGIEDPLYVYEVEHDPAFGARLMEAEDTFWRRYVKRRQPPPADTSEATAKALRVLYPKDSGKAVTLDGPAEEWARAFDEATEQAAAIDRKREAAKTALIATLGDAAAGVLPDGSGFTFRTGSRGRSLRRASASALRKYSKDTT